MLSCEANARDARRFEFDLLHPPFLPLPLYFFFCSFLLSLSKWHTGQKLKCKKFKVDHCIIPSQKPVQDEQINISSLFETLLEVWIDMSSQTQQDLKAFLGWIVKSLDPSICRLATGYDWQTIYTADICCVCAVGGVTSHKELHYTWWTFSESQHHLFPDTSLSTQFAKSVNILHGWISLFPLSLSHTSRSALLNHRIHIVPNTQWPFFTLVCQKLKMGSFPLYSEAQRRSQSPQFQSPFPL